MISVTRTEETKLNTSNATIYQVQKDTIRKNQHKEMKPCLGSLTTSGMEMEKSPFL